MLQDLRTTAAGIRQNNCKIGLVSLPFMGLVLTDISAIEIYRRNGTPFGDRVITLPFGKVHGIEALRPCASDLRELDCRGFSSLSRPIHVLVPRATMRHSINDVVWHLHTSALPKASFRQVAYDIFIASPELALFHYAARKDIRSAVLAAYELSGTYRLHADAGFEKAEPLVALKDLKRIEAVMHGARGVASFRRMMRHVTPGSASPMETALAMLLSLPCAMGGYGLPKPQMNARIDLPEKNGLNQACRYYVADLYWPDFRLAIEYDSDQFHVGSDRIAQDAIRRNVLLFAGVTVITVGRQQIMSASKMDDVARVAGRILRHPVRIRVSEWRRRNNELRDAVLFNCSAKGA